MTQTFRDKPAEQRIVITGIGLTAPNGNDLQQFRSNLLEGVSGVQPYNIRYVGDTFAGLCDFDALKFQKRKDLRVGTRAGSIAIYCTGNALEDAGIDLEQVDRSMIGIFIGITEHGNVETENEVFNVGQYDNNLKFWSHHHNPRTVANNPAGEVTVRFGITGPHYTLGAACAAGNVGLINAAQQLLLGEVDVAIAGGVSESTGTFGIFAAFDSQGALARHEEAAKVSRPFDKERNGIVISEGGALYTLERLSDAQARGAKIYGELAGYAINSDAANFVLPLSERQTQCMEKAIKKAGIKAEDIDIVNTHATGTSAGDIQEAKAVGALFNDCASTYINNTKGFIGHCMGAAGALELAGNLPAFDDAVVHSCLNVDELDEKCDLPNLVYKGNKQLDKVDYILNSSFGMLGINSAVIIAKPQA